MKVFNYIDTTINNLHKKIRIVFPEGTNSKIKDVAIQLAHTNIAPVLVYEHENEIQPEVKAAHIETVIIFKQNLEELANYLVELRNGKETIESARKLVTQRHYFSTLMVKKGFVDGMVGGIEYSSKDIIRAALQIIKAKQGMKTVSSAMIMDFKGEELIFTDISLNLDPSSEELVEIAHHAYNFAHALNLPTPQVAFLSFSTKGSGAGTSVEKVKTAAELFKQKYPNIVSDGEFQFDSAFVESTRLKKAPNSTIKGKANVFVFPNLDSGNIGYKIAQQFGQSLAVGPVLLGLDKPVNDLSRGATTQDILLTAKITAFFAIKK